MYTRSVLVEIKDVCMCFVLKTHYLAFAFVAFKAAITQHTYYEKKYRELFISFQKNEHFFRLNLWIFLFD